MTNVSGQTTNLQNVTNNAVAGYPKLGTAATDASNAKDAQTCNHLHTLKMEHLLLMQYKLLHDRFLGVKINRQYCY